MKYGLNIIERPQEIASDEASANDVVRHFLSKLPSNLDKKNTVIVYLQPTSPLRNTKHIQEAIEAMKDKSYTSSISVVKLNKSPYKSFLINPKNGELSSLFDERLSNERRQDLQDVFIPNGAMYIFSIHDFESRGGFPSNGSLPYIMSHDDSIDIDSEQDLNRANDILQDKISSNS
jgi:CMP-N-acetylneuraminic acid synthetase